MKRCKSSKSRGNGYCVSGMEVSWKKRKVKNWKDCARCSPCPAKRRQRTKRGLVFNWPAPRPVRVMGIQWTAELIPGMQGLPHLAVTKCCTTKGAFSTRLRDTEEEAVRICVRKWAPLIVHVVHRSQASAY